MAFSEFVAGQREEQPHGRAEPADHGEHGHQIATDNNCVGRNQAPSNQITTTASSSQRPAYKFPSSLPATIWKRLTGKLSSVSQVFRSRSLATKLAARDTSHSSPKQLTSVPTCELNSK